MTGLRLSEICILTWRHVRLYTPHKQTKGGAVLYGWLAIRSNEGALTKTGNAGRVPVVPQAYELLLRLEENRGASKCVFESPRKGDRLNDWWMSSCFRPYRREAKIQEEIHFHGLRRTRASGLAEAGVDLKVVGDLARL